MSKKDFDLPKDWAEGEEESAKVIDKVKNVVKNTYEDIKEESEDFADRIDELRKGK